MNLFFFVWDKNSINSEVVKLRGLIQTTYYKLKYFNEVYFVKLLLVYNFI